MGLNDALAEVLRRWGRGETTPDEVRAVAERICHGVNFDAPGLEAEGEVCAQLEDMHLQLVIADDVPALLALLAARDDPAALDEWLAYFNAVDFEARAVALRSTEFYRGGAESILRG